MATACIRQFSTTLSDFVTNNCKIPIYEKCALLFEYIYKPDVIGAIAPTSDMAAKKMISKIIEDPTKESVTILEIGSGSGSVTKFILKLEREFELDAVESQTKLANIVKRMVQDADKEATVKIHEKIIQNFSSEHKYNHIVCTLPFNSFKSEVVTEILNQIDNDLLEEDGKVSYIEYMVLPTIKLIFLRVFSLYNPEPYTNFKKVLEAKNDFLIGKVVETKYVLWNIPPARILLVQNQKKA